MNQLCELLENVLDGKMRYMTDDELAIYNETVKKYLENAIPLEIKRITIDDYYNK